MKDTTTLILIAHGSKDPRWREPFEHLEQSLKRTLGEDGIYLAYMEFAEPTLMMVSKQAVRAGAKKVKVLPLFMAGGAHLDKDIPLLVAQVRAVFPGLEVESLGPIGEHPKFADLIEQVAVESA